MPRIEELEQFNEQLVLTGNEPAVLSDKGLEVEAVSPPSEAESQELLGRNSLKVRKSPTAAAAEETRPGPPSLDDLVASSMGGGADDFSDLFGDSEADSSSSDIFGDLFGDTDQTSEDSEEVDSAAGEAETDETTDEGIAADETAEPQEYPVSEIAAGPEDSGSEAAEEMDFGSLFDEDIIPPPAADSAEPTPEEEALLDDFLSSFGSSQADDEDLDDGEPSPDSEPSTMLEPDTEPALETEPEPESEPEPEPDFQIPAETEPEPHPEPEPDLASELQNEAQLPQETEPEPAAEDLFEPETPRNLPDDAGELPEDFLAPADDASFADADDFAAALDSQFDEDLADELGEFAEQGDYEDFENLEAEAPEEVPTESAAPTEDFGEPDSFAEAGDVQETPDFGDLVGGEDAFGSEQGAESEGAATTGDLLDSLEAELEQPDEFGDADFGDAEFSDSGPENLFDTGEIGDFGAADGEADEDLGFEGSSEPDPFAADIDQDFGAGFGGDEEFSDEFSMGDFGAEFGILDEEPAKPSAAPEAPGSKEAAEELSAASASDQAEGLALTDQQFAALQAATDYLPLNVKSAVAEVIADGTGPYEDLKTLIDALVSGETPRKIAVIVSRISGKRVVVPKGYEKRSGLAFAEEQDTFLYQLREKIWPVLRVALLITAATSLLAYLSYNFIYRPVHANNLYNQGLAAIADEQYPRGNTLFDRAYAVWPVQGRFFDFARAFAAQREYPLAQEKYEQLLRIEPLHREGILEYADFAAYTLRDYQTGVDVLNRLLDITKSDYEPLLSQADIYMEWARYTDKGPVQDQLYDNARSAYVRLSAVHGQTDPILFRLLLYFVRTGDLARAFRLQQVFDADQNVEIEPRIYGELAGFYIDTWVSGQTSPILPAEDGQIVPSGFGPDLLEEAEDLLLAALEKETRIPEVHYQLARIFGERDQRNQERRALISARSLFSEARQARSLTQFELAQEIDTLVRIGESNQRSGNLITAEQDFRNALALYERGRDSLQVSPEHSYGRIYAHLGNLYYYQGNDYPAAYQFFSQAFDNGYGRGNRPTLPLLVRDLQYKMGFIRYGDGNRESYQDALELFLAAEGPTPAVNPNLIYAKANALYQLGNYNAAAAQYQRLISRLVEQRERIATFLIQEDSAHRGLIDFLIRSYNNLGVTMFQLSRTAGTDRVRRQVEAQFYLSRATELSENVARDEETAIRAETQALAYLNLRSILVSSQGGEVLLDPDLPKDLDAVVF